MDLKSHTDERRGVMAWAASDLEHALACCNGSDD
jgi:hypothetical protein